MTWDPTQYLRFQPERSRPFFDLLEHVTWERVNAAADLGCGTGELTRALCERWPDAAVIGVDSSPEMLDHARKWTVPGRLEFVQADISTWESPRPLDLIVSNAALQWVGNHDKLLPALCAMLAPAGTLAVQLPCHFETPAHRVIAEVTEAPRWQAQLHGVGLQPGAVRPLAWYVERLLRLGLTVDAWETTYLHVLRGENPVLEWMKGTALRPLLARLEGRDREEFLRELGERLRSAYPATDGITLFPFPRLFFVATCPA
jgi:trans-aconitate 2-methyltransferase